MNRCTVRKNPETSLKFLQQLMRTIFISDVLNLISDLPENFRTIACEIQQLPLKKSEVSDRDEI